ncbi:WXG100 family type VII secretion target [Mediterraneibacter glycyrrhizinilyticus]|uniref:WXG100 family type VII secretion target n=1 Tax=Mediterraneibacter glycyrrhizinilyticus TaxID=342942 RepID=UPI001960FE5D|nr:WXG100 family type VII secretion target [Mediterraneibacter glycyrrhizinilyticus]MBM6801345.1 WXG100 family type VII secretion target [Mediterraneibacter glycyrrhizinilyticus]MDM8123981.1 WXG100 family type VII secretion target [Mediterraneibacter glycyrrhizinilyticus]
MAKGSYDIAGMRSSATKITTSMDTYRTNREKINSVVEDTTQYWEDPVNKDYVQKFQNLKQDMESVQNLMNAYAEYLTQAAKVIEDETTV